MTQQGKKMSSVSPLPPPTPPAQKPVRIVKARPPMRPRPHLAPRPDSDKLHTGTHAAAVPPESARKILGSSREPEKSSSGGSGSGEAAPPETAKEQLNSLKHSGNVKKIVGQFDQAVVQQDKETPPPIPEKKPLPQPAKPARISRGPSDVTPHLAKVRTVNFVLNSTENGVEGTPVTKCQEAEEKVDHVQENHFHQEGENHLDVREDQPLSRHLEHSEEDYATMQGICQRDCPCICHAQRPGMVMVWVPEPKAQEPGVEDDLGTLSDSSSSVDESPRFHQVFVVNREAPEPTKQASEDVNGNLAGDVPDRKGRSPKGSMPLTSKKPFGGRYPVQHQSLMNASDVANGLKNAGLTNGHHDGPPSESSGGSNVVLTSYRPVPDCSFSKDEVFKATPHCDGRASDSETVCETPREPPGESVPPAPSVPKPPRKSKLGSQTSLENEAPQPALPPKAPRKPPRTSLAPLPFFRKGSLKKQLDKHILEEDETQEAGSCSHSLPAGQPYRRRSSWGPSSREPKEVQEHFSLGRTSKGECEANPSEQTRQDLDGAALIDRSSAVTSPKSIDWESRLQDEPLYQTYRQAVIRKEIKRQTVPRNSSITSFDCSPSASEYGGNSPRSRRSITPQNTLWQELPAVRESGILQNMTTEERKMQESMFEVLTSEASYLRSLAVLTEHFMECRDLDDSIIIREKKILFSNILKVKEVSERFLKDLEERVDESLYITDICDIIYNHAQQNFLVYIDYVRNQVYQEKTYSSLMERNVQFAIVVTRLQELPQCQRLPFMSFLLLPFQRITRIKMLIENILKRTDEGSVREQNAMKALTAVSKIIEECNSEVGRMKQMEELIHITKKIEFDKLKAVPIISQARYLEKQGELSEVVQKGSLFGMKPKVTPVYFFLFNDFLLITHRKSSERHVVVDYAHRSLVQVQGCSDYSHGGPTENSFFLTLLENHQGKTCDRLFKAPSQSDMHRWMGAFPRQKEQPHSSDETIYEDWDCPQVQCVESYTAMQADELSLEPTDIINILRKTTEGWYEGIRLSDGLKGWFPSKYVQEITNEHVRRRNLRERYRVLQAARQIQVTRTCDTKKKYLST